MILAGPGPLADGRGGREGGRQAEGAGGQKPMFPMTNDAFFSLIFLAHTNSFVSRSVIIEHFRSLWLLL